MLERIADEIAALSLVFMGGGVILYSMMTPNELGLTEVVTSALLLIEPGIAYLFGKSMPKQKSNG